MVEGSYCEETCYLVFDLCSKYFCSFPSSWAEHAAGETLLVGVILGCMKTILWFVFISNVREERTNVIVLCPFSQTPPNLMVWSKTFVTLLPSLEVHLSRKERNPKISCTSLSPCYICEKRAGFLCLFLFLW